jgi:O-antigen/teichoic acid export membrane protein
MSGPATPATGFKRPVLRLSRLHFGFLGQAMGQIVQIAVRLAEVPVFLHFWSAERYGEWLLVTAIPGLLTLGDLGVSQSAVRGMTTANAAGHSGEALAIFQSGALVTFAFSMVFSLLFVVAALFPAAGGAIGLGVAATAVFLPIVAVLAAYTILSMQVLLLFGVLQSAGRYPLGFALLAGARLLEFGTVVAAIAAGGGLRSAALGMLSAQIVSYLVFYLLAHHHAPWLRLGFSAVGRKTIGALVRPSLSFSAFPLAQAINLQFVRLLIGGALGPGAVVQFTTHRQFGRLLNSVANLMLSVQAELGLAYGGGDLERFRFLAVRTFRFLVLAGTLAFVALLLSSHWIFSRWTVGRVPYDAVLLITLSSASLVELLWRGALAPVMATNRHDRVALVYLAMQLLCIPAILVGLRFGFDTVGYAICGAEVATLLFVLVEFRRITGVPLRTLLGISRRHG